LLRCSRIRGNNRRPIFHAPADYQKFLSLLAVQKAKLPFFLYAYCLMTNHVHLLIERQAATIGLIMHRLLTGYSQYYNRRYCRGVDATIHRIGEPVFGARDQS
jgi:REP element-mobilizing transposase RayT